jgi:GNAT superfamily N-acetyltransferase
MPMTGLRPARESDIQALDLLIARSGRELSAAFYTPAQADAITAHVFGVDTQLIADQTYYVIEENRRLVACGGWSRRATLFGGDHTKHGEDALLDPASDPARIRAFFVEPAMARRGYGRRLLDACISAARAAGFRALELVATLPGEPLYRSAGFVVTERFELTLPGDVRVPVVRMRMDI